ncbi:MAG: GNAT family N-acetyltransferase [Acidimicrobiales bacterium]
MDRTDRLLVEPLGHEHADGLFAALDDPRVGEHIGGPDVTTIERLHHRIDRLAEGPPADWAEDRWLNWVARRTDDGVIVGRLEATAYPAGWAEIAYVFGPAFWGHGYATEGVRWMIQHLRAELGIADLWGAVHPDNAGSIRLLERLGFERRTPPARRPVASYDDGDLLFELPAPQ